MTTDLAWEYHATIFSHTYQLIDGREIKAQLIMRAKTKAGQWQHREATEAERADWLDRLQW
jgi:hypothetical protein